MEPLRPIREPSSAVPTPGRPGRIVRAVWHRRWVRVLACVAGAGAVCFAVLTIYVTDNIEPILRNSVVDTLSRRFHSPVELDHLDISLVRGVEVRGRGLRILYLAGPSEPDKQQLMGHGGSPPMVSISRFAFRTSLGDLVHLRTRIATVYVDGMELRIPPRTLGDAVSKRPAHKQPAVALLVDRIECRNSKLFIETSRPGKDPLEFDIASLDLTDVGADRPLIYVADVTNPRPRGNVHAFGHLGPWHGDDPRSTPIDGDYRIDHMDLGSIKGLGGSLSGTGHYDGTLGSIAVDGTSTAPDFSLDVSDRPMPLATKFHAVVDGTTGDTTLAPVQARLGHTDILAEGAVMRVHGKGHDIALTLNIPHGRMEDLLQLGMKTRPPVMRGVVKVRARLHIPPGQVRVAQKMQMQGELTMNDVTFGNPKVQQRVDSLSLRAQGRPKDARLDGRLAAAGPTAVDPAAAVTPAASRLAATFSLDRSLVTVDKLHYELPGARADMDGVYSMDGNIFEFKGHVRTDATASQMVTGWKSMLLRPFDGLLKKNGAGLELPVAISGVDGDMKMGLAYNSVDESTQDMAAEVKAKRQSMQAAKPAQPAAGVRKAR